jgi:epoxyqueuosine reductase
MLEAEIRHAAQQLGFATCRFACVVPPPHAAFFERWLAAGQAGGMTYLERGFAARVDPSRLLAGARTVISLAFRYLAPPSPPPQWQPHLRGRIAAYAFGADYHQVIGARLRELVARIVALRPRARLRPYVDTGPVLEREWGAAGGVGWFGKNTNLLHSDHGSYFFVAELLTDLSLEPDATVPDRCGSCTRCLDRCPTAAFRGSYDLDARRCISYLTIEHRGPIPRDLRSRLGNWIFGCDVCQEVCPWNERLLRRQPATADAEKLCPWLPDLLRLDERGFQERFRHSAVRRSKREGLLRNVAVAMGNSHHPSAVGPLAAALRDDPAALVRAHAAWALGEIGGRSARAALATAWQGEADAAVRVEIEQALR